MQPFDDSLADMVLALLADTERRTLPDLTREEIHALGLRPVHQLDSAWADALSERERRLLGSAGTRSLAVRGLAHLEDDHLAPADDLLVSATDRLVAQRPRSAAPATPRRPVERCTAVRQAQRAVRPWAGVPVRPPRRRRPPIAIHGQCDTRDLDGAARPAGSGDRCGRHPGRDRQFADVAVTGTDALLELDESPPSIGGATPGQQERGVRRSIKMDGHSGHELLEHVRIHVGRCVDAHRS